MRLASIRLFCVYLANFLLSGCGTIVKNPKKPNGNSAALVDINRVVGAVLAEIQEASNAPDASIGRGESVLGFKCVVEGAKAKITFDAKATTSKTLSLGTTVVNATVNDSQSHTHTWSGTSNNPPDCAGNNLLSQRANELNGFSLSYAFTQTVAVTLADGLKQDSLSTSTGTRTIQMSATSQDSLSYALSSVSKATRTIDSQPISISWSSANGGVDYSSDRKTWDRKKFASEIVAESDALKATLKAEGLVFQKSSFGLCIPSEGKITGRATGTGEDDVETAFTLEFSSSTWPRLKLDSDENSGDLRLVNCPP